MMHSERKDVLRTHAWLVEFLVDHGFQRSEANSFTNGRATLRIENGTLVAIPGDGSRPWRGKLDGANVGALRQLLTIILAAPSFLPGTEHDPRTHRQRSAEAVLEQLTKSIQQQPESAGSQQLRHFLASLLPSDQEASLSQLRSSVSADDLFSLGVLFAAYLEGLISVDALRKALAETQPKDSWEKAQLPLL